jgi:pentatricopeptide repeat domain-containing protein 1
MDAIVVYQRMLSMGLKPNATTYVALLTAFARTGQLEATLNLFNTMADHGFERGAHCFAAVLSACEPQGRWDLALQLLQHMQMDGVRPSTACMNSVISACLNGVFRWREGGSLLQDMLHKVLTACAYLTASS